MTYYTSVMYPVLTIMVLLLLLTALGGCVTTEQEIAYLRARTYDRAEVDAINAEAACKAQARNLLQVSRCTVNRRGP